VIRGSSGAFSPNDAALRAQMAAFICRALGWDGEDHSAQGYPTFSDLGGVDTNLRRNIGTLQYYGVARGYGDNTFHPYDPVLKAQVISFLTRGWVTKGYWASQPDNGAIYPNVPASSGNRGDLVTYADYTGAVPGTGSPYSNWGDWSVNAPRSWFAQAEWQAFVQAGV